MAKASEASDAGSNLLRDLMASTELMLAHQTGDSKRRGRRVELYPPSLIRSRHQMAKQQRDEQVKMLSNVQGTKQFFEPRQTLNIKINACKTAFDKLTRTTIPELFLEESAKGKFILARVIEEWFSISAWNNVIEDHKGHVIGLTLYNYPVEEIFSLGDVIIIKEPYLRLPLDNFPIMRCDCPTDIIVLRPAHPLFQLVKSIKWKNSAAVNNPLTAKPLPSTALQWKERGNGCFDRDQLVLAREAYQMALAACSKDDPTWKTAHLNLLAVQLRLEYFEWVVKNGEKFLIKFPDEKKAIFRLGKAYYGLRNYDKALENYQKFCTKFPEEKEGSIELERAKERVRETKGEFDFAKLRKMSNRKPLEEMDCADYCGPVKITKIPGKGRGLVLTEDVEKGTVLMVSKALAAVLDPLSKLSGVQMDPGRRVDLGRDRAENVAKVSRLIMKNPNSFGPQVYDLYSGENLIEPAQLFCDPGKKEVICDVELIKNISRCNSFDMSQICEGKIKSKGGGLFLLPSYMNHSCVPNADAYEFYNDVMVVRAVKDMKEGTEVTVSYVPLEKSFEERAKDLSGRGFKCRCTRCKRRM